MAFKLRLLAICDNVVQHQGRVDLVGVHFTRRVKAFPETAKLWLYFEATLSGQDGQGNQEFIVRVRFPGMTGKPQEGRLTVGLGNPATPSIVLAPISIEPTFDRPGTWTFEVYRGQFLVTSLEYQVVSEETAEKAAEELKRLAEKKKAGPSGKANG